MKTQWNLKAVSDDALIARLGTLLGREHLLLAEVLAHMAEVDERKLYCAYAYPSMFRYAVSHLGFDEGAARHRLRAARLARRVPVIFDRVAAGVIHLAGLNVLATHLTAVNHLELLDAASNKSRRQIEELIAARFPRSDVLPLITPVTANDASDGGDDTSDPRRAAPQSAKTHQPHVATGAQPLSADSFCVTFTIDRKCRDKLAHAQALLRHAIPSGDMGAIFDQALEALLEKRRKQKYAKTDAPRPGGAAKPKPGSRHIPAEVKRQVAARDGERCTFVGKTGRRCNEMAWAEFHHDDPFGRGGPTTPSIVRILCALCRIRHKAHYADYRIMPTTAEGVPGIVQKVVFYAA